MVTPVYVPSANASPMPKFKVKGNPYINRHNNGFAGKAEELGPIIKSTAFPYFSSLKTLAIGMYVHKNRAS